RPPCTTSIPAPRRWSVTPPTSAACGSGRIHRRSGTWSGRTCFATAGSCSRCPNDASYRRRSSTVKGASGRSGAIWRGNWGKGGADRLDPVTGRVVAVRSDLPSVSNTFYEDAAGTLWIGAGGGVGGVYACTPSTMTCRAEGSSDLRSKFVYALYGDRDGRLWAGTVGGLFRYDGRSWTHLPASSGAPNATVRAFASTRDGALWMGTNGGGLARYREGTFTPVTRAD